MSKRQHSRDRRALVQPRRQPERAPHAVGDLRDPLPTRWQPIVSSGLRTEGAGATECTRAGVKRPCDLGPDSVYDDEP
jgi:hypothetical protein